MIKNHIAPLLAAALLLAGCGDEPEKLSHLQKCDNLRVVSLAPNVTEILYALGLSNEVVGVSRYSNYPFEVTKKPFVGGTYDPNWEMIVSLQPDLVIGLDSQKEIAAQLKQLDINFLGVPHERINDILQSILIIGETCGAQAEAQQLFQGLEKQLADFSKVWKNPPPASRTPPRRGFPETTSPPPQGFPLGRVDLDKPKVLVCIGHDEQLTRMYIAARNTFYDDLINLAGGTNACEQTAIKYPEISPEGLRAMQPDLVIDLVSDLGSRLSLRPNDFSKEWKPYRAVTITNSYAFIPGPRFVKLLEDLSTAIRQNNLEAE